MNTRLERDEVEPAIDISSLSTELALDLLRRMLEIRYFEDEVNVLFTRNLVRGSTHLCQGQEAVTVGTASMLRQGDHVSATYRGHGAALSMGVDHTAAFAELLGRAGGLCGGKGGSMHFTDVRRGVHVANGIVGGHLPFAMGLGLASKLQATEQVSVAYFGDGSTNIGAFHETLNMAALWSLPVIFIIENNQYGEYSPLRLTTPIDRLADRAQSYGMPSDFIDGNDIVSVRDAVGTAVTRARTGQGPTLIEANTYRQVGHSRSDPAKYRPEGELEWWLQRDPIKLLTQSLLQRHPDLDSTVRGLEASTKLLIESSRLRALQMPEPDLSMLYQDVLS